MILITGGTGYIGSHTLVELAKANYDFLVYDNLTNSSKKSLEKVSQIINKKIIFVKGDIRDKGKLKELFTNYKINSVIHFAGLKSVNESLKNPLQYYDNNVLGTINLLNTMEEFNCKKIVFSSSATVYGDPKTTPIKENFPVGNTTNPYGTSKYMIEKILQDLQKSDKNFKIIILRYFNPAGAHESGLIGEYPKGKPHNLFPYITQIITGEEKYLKVFGNDYNTHDGTGIRDYIHVMDLATAHVKAIDYLNSEHYNNKNSIFNIGTGVGYSVLDVLKTFEKVSGTKIPYKIVDRRKGDIAKCFTDVSNVKKILSWEATRNLTDMCKDTLTWQKKNPFGYDK